MDDAFEDGFRTAGVPLEFAATPIVGWAPEVFQMDIRSSDGQGERVRVWPGDEHYAAVLDRDLDRGQLVVHLEEPRRRIERSIPRPSRGMRERVLAALAAEESVYLAEREDVWRVESWAPGRKRRFLVGYDDGHLFISRVRWGDTVLRAHAALKPDEVRDAERRWPGAVNRQGEWFFIPVRPQERLELGRLPEEARGERAIEPARRPHIASEHARIGSAVFVRGTIRHADHRPVVLEEWRRAVRNAAVVEPAWPGLGWVD